MMGARPGRGLGGTARGGGEEGVDLGLLGGRKRLAEGGQEEEHNDDYHARKGPG